MSRQFSRILTGTLSAATVLAANLASADEPLVVLHEDVVWQSIGGSGLEMALLAGDPTQAGPYSFMLRVPQGARLELQSHPDVWRHATIISGTLMWAVGDTAQEASMVALTPDSSWTEPFDAGHYGWAWEGDVIAVVTAMGPRGIIPVAGN